MKVDFHPSGLVGVAGPGKHSTVWAVARGMETERRLAVKCEGVVLGMHISRSPQPVLVTGDTSGDVSVWRIPKSPPWRSAETTSAETRREGTRSAEARSAEAAQEPLVTRLKNSALVFCVRISRDHRLVVTGDVKGIAKIWDAERGAVVHEWVCDSGKPVRAIDIAQETVDDTVRLKLIATGSAGGLATVWDVERGTELRSFHCRGMIYSVDLSGDQKYLVTGDQSSTAIVWDVATGCVVKRFACSDVVKRVDLSGDSTLLAGKHPGAQALELGHTLPAIVLLLLALCGRRSLLAPSRRL